MSLERPWQLHWHTQQGFTDLATAAGLTVSAILADGVPPSGHRFALRPDELRVDAAL